MNRYQYYKNVPETWIGDIPVHWKISLVSRHFNIGRGRVISKVEIFENKGDFPVYSSQTTNNGELGKINTYDFDGEYVTWTTDGANTGTCFHRNGKFNTTNVCGMLSKRNILFELKYLCFYLNLVTKPYVRIDINPKLMNNMMGEYH
ncbi:Type I restriction modification DNA specificity domain-containing protein [Polaribacter sp. Hel1_33_78]|uniref:restriction endonuclease subunit S n=1 Tax=Polaribacter sp. Hel1_33_78 TaxID=1336804 RepID=UPI00087A4878|nr:restriction endonuclease subunit S [Polaribacter sp. Hel1_33_78]SDU27892.1 Type I restriction modification DNA specificity domain-containing protein [Polaribacter sp. Hel1_33_78]